MTGTTPIESDVDVGYVALDDGLAAPAYAHHDDLRQKANGTPRHTPGGEA